MDLQYHYSLKVQIERRLFFVLSPNAVQSPQQMSVQNNSASCLWQLKVTTKRRAKVVKELRGRQNKAKPTKWWVQSMNLGLPDTGRQQNDSTAISSSSYYTSSRLSFKCLFSINYLICFHNNPISSFHVSLSIPLILSPASVSFALSSVWESILISLLQLLFILYVLETISVFIHFLTVCSSCLRQCLV